MVYLTPKIARMISVPAPIRPATPRISRLSRKEKEDFIVETFWFKVLNTHHDFAWCEVERAG